jgi:hypothetical protein
MIEAIFLLQISVSMILLLLLLGEITIRHSLEEAFKLLNISLTTLHSDREFNDCDAKGYDIILLDPWTWAKQGWVPKDVIRGLDDRIYILDFFGSERLRGSGLTIPPSRILTAFGSKWNTFLGYYMEELDHREMTSIKKKHQGVIWGKDTKHYTAEKVQQLKQLLDSDVMTGVQLISTSTSQILVHSSVKWVGHVSASEWKSLLMESKFLIGLGDPLLGPSAMDAIAYGCMYINPVYQKGHPKREVHLSQHPYAEHSIGEPFVCSYKIDSFNELRGCVEKALKTGLQMGIPADLSKERYLERVRKIFI